MPYILDTNIISEALKPKPDHNTIWWMQDHNEDLLFNVVSVEEVYDGIFRMPEGKRKARIRKQFDAFVKECANRTLPFDAFSAYLCAELAASARKMGRPITIEDCMIAAICKRNDGILVTRNVKDFDYLGIETFNPFTYEPETLQELRRRETERGEKR